MSGPRLRPCVATGMALCVLAGLAACARDEAATPPRTPRNVLLVSIDSLRADRLGIHGNPRETSPTLDELARGGAWFTRAYSPSSWTLPSHASLLTGFQQRRHGAVNPHVGIREGLPSLATILSAQGFETRGVFAGPFVHGRYGFDRGFDEYVDCQGYDDDGPLGLLPSHSIETNGCVRRQVRRWTRAEHERPFFWFVHLWDVHYDYDPPARYVRRFDPLYLGTLDGRHIPGAGFPATASPRDVAHLLARYDAEVRRVDDTIAVLLGVMRKRNLLDDTLVVVTADHGDEFREHGRKGHQKSVYDESVHVPLVFWGPGVPRGRVVDHPVAILDVAPTILDALGIPAPSMDGASLRGLLVGTTTEARPVVSVLYAPSASAKNPPIRSIAVRDATTTLMRPPGRRHWVVFDPRHDRLEQMPLPIRTTAEQARALAAESRARITSADEARTRPIGIPPETRQRLRDLGYAH